MGNVTQLSPNLFRQADTCNVYLLRDGERGLAVDFGSGAVLDEIGETGVGQLGDVLVTHHHRDQVQGLRRAVEAGAQIWVPPVERDLIADIDEHWQSRELDVDYNVREDRFSILEGVPVAGSVTEYRSMRFGSLEVLPLPTPGHTVGSVSYLSTVDGKRVAFTGDLIYAPGKIWSLAATMWNFGEMHGVAATMLSLLALRHHQPDMLLPSHGEPIADPLAAIDETVASLRRMIEFRASIERFDEWLTSPYVELSPHLLHNITSHSYSYALLSDSGKALLIDYGYDAMPGLAAGTDRASRRPWLYSLDWLKRDHGVEKVDVVIPTHYHDDHVAGFNLLREVEGTRVWTPDHFADVLERPTRYNLPCLWYEPIGVDRHLPTGGNVRWEEYEIGIHALPGHTYFAAAFSFIADGTRVVATGDQQDKAWARDVIPGGRPHERLNHIYAGRVSVDDFVKSAQLYARLEPELMISGHWRPRKIHRDYLEMLEGRGRLFEELHRELLPLEDVNLGLEGYSARIEPYRSEVGPGSQVEFDVWVRNPLPDSSVLRVELVVPNGWTADPGELSVTLDGLADATLRFCVTVGAAAQRRARIAADVTAGDRRLGQHAEALVTVLA